MANKKPYIDFTSITSLTDALQLFTQDVSDDYRFTLAVFNQWLRTQNLESFMVTCSAFETDITTGTNVAYFDLPYDFKITGVVATLKTAPTGSVATFDVNVDGATILSTKITIDATEVSSLTAATQPVISDSDHNEGQRVSVDIDGIGSTVAGQDLQITILGYKI